MSTNSGDEEVDCRQILEDVYVFLDNECDEGERRKIRNHLDECYPCLQKFGIEQEVKHILATKCGGDRAPSSLRETLRTRLSEIIIDEPA